MIKLKGETMISLQFNELNMIISYAGAEKISRAFYSMIFTETDPKDISISSSHAVQKAAQAFMEDAASSPIRLTVDELTLSEEIFSGNGRTDGRFGEVFRCRLEVLL